MGFCIYPDRSTQASTLANQVAEQLQAAVESHGIARLVVPGGTTPQAFLEALALQPLKWERVRMTLSDERQVAAYHPRSNLRLIRHALQPVLDRVTLVPLHEADISMDEREALLRDTLLPLDVAVLGMGEDGHIASLFPGMPDVEQALDPQSSKVLWPVPVLEHLPEARLSLTLAALLSASHLHLLVTGQSKRATLQAALLDTAHVLPVSRLLALAQTRLTVHWAP